MSETTERWLPIPGYEGIYEVSDRGRVRSVDRWIQYDDGRRRYFAGQVLAIKMASDRRPYVVLSNRGVAKSRRVHRLVLETFVCARPPGLVGCHNNGDSTDNRVANLRWDTQRENILDELRHGTHPKASQTHCLRQHLLVHPNLVPGAARKGHRQCRACARAGTAQWKAVRAGSPFDLRYESDRQYRRIMEAAA